MLNSISDEYKIAIGNALLRGRKRKDMSRAAIGKMVGLHETTIKRYEDGKIKNVNLDKINEIATILNIDLHSVLLWVKFDEENPNLSEQTLNIECFEDALVALGYKIKTISSAKLSFNQEESERLAVEAANKKDLPYCEITKEGQEPIILTVKQYEDFQVAVEYAIQYELNKFKK